MSYMTEGTPWKLLLKFTLPVLAGNIFQNFYNIMDAMIVGRYLGVNALAAVGGTGSLMFLVIGWIIGIESGFGVLVSQKYGAKQQEQLTHYVSMAMYLSIILAVIMTSALFFLNEPILRLMDTPKEIFADTSSYMAIIYAGLPITILYNLMAALNRSIGDSKTPLYFLIISSILNVILDIILVGYTPMGVAGAAVATVVSQGVSAVLCVIYTAKKHQVLKFSFTKWRTSSAGRMLSVAIPMALQFSITAIGTMIVQVALNHLGAVYIASYSAANKLQNITMQFYVALGTGLATFVGQNYGAKKIDRIKKGVNVAVRMVAVYSVFVMLISYFILPNLVVIFAKDSTGQLRELARQLYHISLWFYFPLGLIFIYRNTLQGVGNGLVPMLGGVFELLARFLTILLLFPSLQYVGVCLSDPAAWISALIPLIPFYYWYMKKKVNQIACQN